MEEWIIIRSGFGLRLGDGGVDHHAIAKLCCITRYMDHEFPLRGYEEVLVNDRNGE